MVTLFRSVMWPKRIPGPQGITLIHYFLKSSLNPRKLYSLYYICIQDSLGLWILRCVLRIPIGSGIPNSLSSIHDSKSKNFPESGFRHIERFGLARVSFFKILRNCMIDNGIDESRCMTNNKLWLILKPLYFQNVFV